MNILLIGRDTSITNTIEEILSSYSAWTVEIMRPAGIRILHVDGDNSKKCSFSVIVANLTDFSERPVEVIQALKTVYPVPPLLALGIYEKKELIQPLLKAGAAYYLQLGFPEKNLLQTVKSLVKRKSSSSRNTPTRP